MKFLNEVLDFFKNLTIENAVDIGIGLAIILIFKIISSSLAYIIVKMFKFKVKDKNKIKNNGFYKPLKTFFIVLGIYIGFMVLKLPSDIFSIITKAFRICVILLVTKGFSNLFDSNSESFAKLREKINFNGNDTTINFFSKVAKLLIYIIAGFILITELGYNLGGLATGLGISSVVIALAAQDIAKSFLAGISIISDKPFEIGDFITVDGLSGTVEDITFRTTRIRNADNQVIIIPNSTLIDNNIINSSKRDSRRFLTVLTLELDTPLEKVSELTENIKVGKDATEVDVLIIVEKENLKKIIIGHQGEMIKRIGIESRKDIEKLLNRKVYLNLFVKTVPKWRDKDRYLLEFGYKNNE